MKGLLFALAVVELVIAAPCRAGVDEGLSAYKSGDFAKARNELEPLAAHGNVVAQRTLASMYAIGQGVKADDVKALAFWRKAGDQGDAESQWELGLEYQSGSRVKRDYALAMEWYRRAAEQGYVPAQINLANLYGGGYAGIPIDHVQAAHWLRLAAAGCGTGRSQRRVAPRPTVFNRHWCAAG